VFFDCFFFHCVSWKKKTSSFLRVHGLVFRFTLMINNSVF
jgi:hypothetical protein